VAAALYRQAEQWAARTEAAEVWDLFCGSGGFALHLARALPGARRVVGVELSEDGVLGGRAGAAELGDPRVVFRVGDAAAHTVAAEQPDLVVVNPPRRGIGPDLAAWLEGSGVQHVLYSSCNARTMASDLEAMPSLEVVAARLFAMFPQTRHHEVLVLLRRR
jgi:23S rRNA (uracil747-C5)-methyltransferase